MLLKTQAATEIAQFLAHHPTPEQIVAFHPSSEVAERVYELIHTERDGSLTEEERKELESYVVIEYLIEDVNLQAQGVCKTSYVLANGSCNEPMSKQGLSCSITRR